MTHVLNRLQLEVSYADEEQAFRLRHQFALACREQIAAAIDTVCSRYVGEEEWLRVEKLEIDLGHFTPYSFDADFARRFEAQFEKALLKSLSLLQPEQKISVPILKAELLKFFLLHGALPWWAGDTEPDFEALINELLIKEPEAMKRFFYGHHAATNLWRRILLQFRTATKLKVIDLLDELKSTKATFTKRLEEIALIVKKTTGPAQAFDEEAVINYILSNAAAFLQKAKEVDVLHRGLQEMRVDVMPETRQTALQPLYENDPAFHLSKGEEENFPANALPDKSEIFTGADRSGEEEKYVVKHAGIVLLAPFLPAFFQNLKLLHAGNWMDKEAQYKGVHLLKYLATGLQKTPEYNLTLEKIICGLPPDEPLPVDLPLQEEETNEAEALLSSVIRLWTALKNTSNNSLREGFFKRVGLLKQSGGGWLLQVERKTLDVLVDSLPWGYSTLHFPWRNGLLFVEW